MSMQSGAGDSHPTAELLMAYCAGELDEARRDELQEHLAHCAACSRVLLDLSGRWRRVDPQVDAAWQATRSLLFGEERTADSRWWRRPRPYFFLRAALAATLLAALAGVVVWEWSAHGFAARARAKLREDLQLLQQAHDSLQDRLVRSESRVDELEATVAALESPQNRVAAADLLPEGYLRRSAPGPEPVGLPEGARYLFLRLYLPDDVGPRELELRVHDPSGRRIVDLSGLRQEPQGTVQLALPTARLAPGKYMLALSIAGEEGVRAEYVLHLAEESERGNADESRPR